MDSVEWFPFQYLLNYDIYLECRKTLTEQVSKDSANENLHTDGYIIFGKDKNISGSKEYCKIPYKECLPIIKTDNNLYELVGRNLARCLYIDIDINACDLDKEVFKEDEIKYHEKEIVKFLPKYILSFIKDKNIDVDLKIIHILYGSRENKISLHFLFKDLMFENYFTMKNFIDHLTIKISSNNKRVDNIYTKFIDLKVYTPNRLIRLPNQTKLGKPNSLLVCGNKKTATKNLLIGHYEAITPKIKKLFINLEPLDAKLLLKANTKIDKKINKYNFICRITKNDFNKYPEEHLLLLDLIPNCKEAYSSKSEWLRVGRSLKNLDNGLELWIKWSLKAKDKYPENESKCIELWNNLETLPIEDLQYIIKDRATEKQIFKSYKEIKDNEKLNKYTLDSSIYKIDINQDFIKNRNEIFRNYLTFIKSKTGTGKTRTIIDFLKELNSKNELKSFLFITTRKAMANSVSSEIKETFQDMKNYQDVKENINQEEFLTIQYESLYKIEGKTTQVLILDEIESIFNLFDSSTNFGKSQGVQYDNTYENFKTFISLIETSTYCVIADANIGCRSVELINYIQKTMNKPIAFIENKYNQVELKKSKAYYLGCCYNRDIPLYKMKFIEAIKQSVLQNKKIYMVIGSKNFAYDIYDSLLNDSTLNLIESDISIYSSLTDDITFKTELSDVKKYWCKRKIIITTSKITNGVDFNIEDYFNCVYLYLTNTSCVVRDYLQSLRRVRHLIDNDIYYLIANNYLMDIANTNINSISKLTNIENKLYNKIVSLNRQEKINTQKNIVYEVNNIFTESGYKVIDLPFTFKDSDKGFHSDVSFPVDYSEYEFYKNQVLNKYVEVQGGQETTQQKIAIIIRTLIRKYFKLTNRILEYSLAQRIYCNKIENKVFNVICNEKSNNYLCQNINKNQDIERLDIVNEIYKILNIDSFFSYEMVDGILIDTEKQKILNHYFNENKCKIYNAFNKKHIYVSNTLKFIINIYTNCIIEYKKNECGWNNKTPLYDITLKFEMIAKEGEITEENFNKYTKDYLKMLEFNREMLIITSQGLEGEIENFFTKM